jgi:hypothetical protein
MFLFYDTTQTDDNKSNKKGELFEKLLSDYLDNSGFDVSIRRKRNSLEYDLEGTDRATSLKVIGEAKAHDKTISGEVLSSFVGKLVPLGIMTKDIKGLFLSTSALTPEADDYYQKISYIGLTAKTGSQLHNEIRIALKLPDYMPLARQLEEKGYRPLNDNILKTNLGTFIVIVTGSNISAAPAHFAVFQTNGQLLSDQQFLNDLVKIVKELQALQPIYNNETKMQGGVVAERTIPSGLIVGTDWTDYRLPAGPVFFVGAVKS